ncbi:MAG: sugar phosphate isomerase/epimerase family protein [Armatimonadota bacterium]
MTFCICNEIFQDFPLERQFAAAAECGYEAIEVAPFTLAESVTDVSPSERRRLVRLAEDNGLAVAGIHWVLVGPKGLHVTTPDAHVRARTVAYLKELVRFTHDIGGSVIVFGSPEQRNVLEGVTMAEARARFAEAVSECMSIPEAEGIRFCVEPLTSEITNLFNTAEEVRQFLRDLDHPRVRMILDCRSMSDEEDDLPGAIRASRDFLAHVHANDDNGLGPGYGTIDFRAVAQALRDVEYGGYVSVEIFDFSHDPMEVARYSLRTLREAFGS